MFFKYCVIGETCYEYNNLKGKSLQGNNIDPERVKIRSEIDVLPIGSDYFENLIRGKHVNADRSFKPITLTIKDRVYQIKDQARLSQEYWKLISTCHECVCDEKETGKREYSVKSS